MAGMASDTLMESFRELEDSRRAQGTRHQLLDIIIIVICGANDVADG